MRKILLTMAAAALALSASAQGLKAPRFAAGLEKAPASASLRGSAVKKAPSKAQLAANQRLVGYYTTDDVDNAIGIGTYTTADIQPGALLEPSDYQQFAGATVVGVRFAMGPSAKAKGVEILGVGSDGSLTSIAKKDTTFSSTSPADNSSYVWNTVMLPADKQFTLNTSDYAGYMVSYKCTQGSRTYPVAINTGVKRTIYINANIPTSVGGNGQGWYNFGSDDGCPAIQLILQSDNFPANGVVPSDFGTFTALVNKDKKVNVTFSNIGESLSNFDYTVTVNGVQSEEKHVDLGGKALGVGGIFTDSVSFTAPAEAGTYDATVNVTKVNGVANEAATTSSKGTLVALSKAFHRGVVVEEFTGTGCGYCPRGLVGMQKLANTYPDNFVGVAIHQYNTSDPAYTKNYASLGFSGAPSCMIDRDGSVIDPYYGSNNSITEDFARHLENLPFLGVDVEGQWNADSTAVTATATVDPLVSGKYNIDFVLVADSLTGSSSSWYQHNYYYQYSASQLPDDLAQFGKGGKNGKSTFKWPFDDVLIASSYNGTTDKATLDDLTAGTPATSTYNLTLPTTTLLKNAINKQKVYVIAIVYDANGVANAAKSTIGGTSTGIQNVNAATDASNAVVARYNAAGQRIAEAQRGLNILKLANGKTVKVIVK